MAHTRHLLAVVLALVGVTIGCRGAAQKDIVGGQIPAVPALPTIQNAGNTQSNPNPPVGGEVSAASAMPKAMSPPTILKSPNVPLFQGDNQMGTFSSDNVDFECDINKTAKCHVEIKKDAFGVISCGMPTSIIETDPNEFFFEPYKYCSKEVTKNTPCPSGKTKLMSGVEGLGAFFFLTIGMLNYTAEKDKTKKARSMYLYCRNDKKEMQVRIDFNGGKSSASSLSGGLLLASVLSVALSYALSSLW